MQQVREQLRPAGGGERCDEARQHGAESADAQPMLMSLHRPAELHVASVSECRPPSPSLEYFLFTFSPFSIILVIMVRRLKAVQESERPVRKDACLKNCLESSATKPWTQMSEK